MKVDIVMWESVVDSKENSPYVVGTLGSWLVVVRGECDDQNH